MKFNYKDFGKVLERTRIRQNLTQRDLEELTEGKIKQPAISEMENGNGRITLDRFIDLCNYMKIRPEELLEPYLTVPQPGDNSDAIVDMYVIQMAEIMENCPTDIKELMMEIMECVVRYQKVTSKKK